MKIEIGFWTPFTFISVILLATILIAHRHCKVYLTTVYAECNAYFFSDKEVLMTALGPILENQNSSVTNPLASLREIELRVNTKEISSRIPPDVTSCVFEMVEIVSKASIEQKLIINVKCDQMLKSTPDTTNSICDKNADNPSPPPSKTGGASPLRPPTNRAYVISGFPTSLEQDYPSLNKISKFEVNSEDNPATVLNDVEKAKHSFHNITNSFFYILNWTFLFGETYNFMIKQNFTPY